MFGAGTALYTSKNAIRATGASGSYSGYATLNGQGVSYSGQANTLGAAIYIDHTTNAYIYNCGGYNYYYFYLRVNKILIII